MYSYLFGRIQPDKEVCQGIVSVRTAAILATPLLVDSEIVSEEDAHLIVDPSKVQRTRERVLGKKGLREKIPPKIAS